MVLSVRYSPEAREALQQLPHRAQQQLVMAVWVLASDPRLRGTIELPGEAAELVADRRAWVGSDYRVVYDVYDDVSRLVVVQVAHRDGVES